MDAPKDLYTISDLAKTTGISRKTVWAWIRAGKLRSHRYGSQHRITEADWKQFLAECNVRERLMEGQHNTPPIREQAERDMRDQITNAVQRLILLHAPEHWTHEQCESAETRMMAGALASFSAMSAKELRSSSERKRLIDIAVIVLRKMIDERK